MNLLLAIRRSYRHFIPVFVLTPRRTVRTLFSPMLCFVTGIALGAELYADRSQMVRIANWTVAATMTLLLLNWWASRDRLKHSLTLEYLRGRTVVATLSLLLGVCYLFASAFIVAFQERKDFQSALHALKIGIILIAVGVVLPSPKRKAG
jgi:cytochrome c biogenesis factor